jgi:hypothetical protein
MSYAERHVVNVTTAADGSATAYSPVVTGKIAQIHYVKTDFADGVDFAITSEATGQSLWTETNVNAAAIRAPRQLTHTDTGSTLAYAATYGVYDKLVLAKDRIKIVIAQGGDTKSGAFHIVME